MLCTASAESPLSSSQWSRSPCAGSLGGKTDRLGSAGWWTLAEDTQALREDIPVTDIARKLGRSFGSVYKRRNRLRAHNNDQEVACLKDRLSSKVLALV